MSGHRVLRILNDLVKITSFFTSSILLYTPSVLCLEHAGDAFKIKFISLKTNYFISK